MISSVDERPKLRAVGIHIFAGLFTQGLVDAGYAVSHTFEDDMFGVKTHKANFPSTKVVVGRAHWHDESVAANLVGQVDLVYSNSACAGWSTASSTKGMLNNSNEGMITSTKFAQYLRPRFAVLESVTNLFKEGDPLVTQWEAEWAALGYRTCRLTESGWHVGLPQDRKRAIFIASRDVNLDFSYGEVAFLNDPDGLPITAGHPISVRDAIHDLNLVPVQELGQSDYYPIGPENPYQSYMRGPESDQDDPENLVTFHIPDKITAALASVSKYLPPGKRFEHVSDEIMAKTYWPTRTHAKKPQGRPSLMYRRLEWDKPCSVITGQGMFFHPEHDRLLTIREQCRCMGVPDRFIFDVKRPGEAYKEIGKAVSPLVGRWIGAQIRQLLASPPTTHCTRVDLIRNERWVLPDKGLEWIPETLSVTSN